MHTSPTIEHDFAVLRREIDHYLTTGVAIVDYNFHSEFMNRKYALRVVSKEQKRLWVLVEKTKRNIWLRFPAPTKALLMPLLMVAECIEGNGVFHTNSDVAYHIGKTATKVLFQGPNGARAFENWLELSQKEPRMRKALGLSLLPPRELPLRVRP